jgi:ribosomal protein S18 acetylase RimI-like enzyme
MSQRVVTIRGADRSDVPGIADVARQTWTATYAGIIPDEVQRQLLESWYSAPALSRAIASPGAFLVATQAGRVVGFAQFVWRPPESAELARIYVRPERQHVGVGTMLLDAGFAACRKRGVGRVSVLVEWDNVIGRAFYRSRAFTEIGKRRQEVVGYSLDLVECHREI